MTRRVRNPINRLTAPKGQGVVVGHLRKRWSNAQNLEVNAPKRGLTQFVIYLYGFNAFGDKLPAYIRLYRYMIVVFDN